MDINQLFPDVITKITSSLLPPHFVGDMGSIRRMQDSVKRVLDQLGEMSAEEQGLGKTITTAEKLRTADGHILYLLKDPESNRGAGEAVGLLKVGKKHLYLVDGAETVHEVEPLCVLDFFVKKSHQRRGYGKKLFDYMLQDQQTSPDRLAVDGPSSTMKKFLAKNYNITQLIKQSYNFAISPRFFGELPASPARSWKRQKNILSGDCPIRQRSLQPDTTPLSSPNGRFTARQPPSTMGNVIHGDDIVEPRQDGEKCQRASSGAPTPASSPLGAGKQAAAGLATGGGGGAGDPQRPSSLAVAPGPPAEHCPAPATPAGTPSIRDSQLTDKGYFDVKFYHKKLW